jgi:hypothetical protein
MACKKGETEKVRITLKISATAALIAAQCSDIALHQYPEGAHSTYGRRAIGCTVFPSV